MISLAYGLADTFDSFSKTKSKLVSNFIMLKNVLKSPRLLNVIAVKNSATLVVCAALSSKMWEVLIYKAWNKRYW